MTRKLIYAAGFLVLTAVLSSCDLEICKVCTQVVTQNGNVIEEKNEATYCGAELITIEATPPVTVGNLTTTWECR